jgi:hypothetical protein
VNGSAYILPFCRYFVQLGQFLHIWCTANLGTKKALKKSYDAGRLASLRDPG